MFIKIISLVSFAFLLIGCGPMYETQYTYTPPASNIGKFCAAECINHRSSCEQMCHMTYNSCMDRMEDNARREFEHYKMKKISEGKKIERSLEWYRHPSECRNDCGCQSTYHDCYTTCGGKVTAREVCVANCDKQ